MTHPFHPWHGRRFEVLDCQRRWGQWRIYYLSENGCTAYMPAVWTNFGPKDPFVEQSQGRAVAHVEDLMELVKLVEKSVKTITPQT